MSFSLVQSGGSVTDAAFINVTGSGVVKNGEPVDRSRTADYLVAPTTSSSTNTMILKKTMILYYVKVRNLRGHPHLLNLI